MRNRAVAAVAACILVLGTVGTAAGATYYDSGYRPTRSATSPVSAPTWAFMPAPSAVASQWATLKSVIVNEMKHLESVGGRASYGANLPIISSRQLADGTSTAQLLLEYHDIPQAKYPGCWKTGQPWACRTGKSIIWWPQGYNGAPSAAKYCELASVSGCYSIATITAHEFGHEYGLEHYQPSGAPVTGPGAAYTIMQPMLSSAKPTEYGQCDIAALQMLYGLKSSSSRISMCLPYLGPVLDVAPTSVLQNSPLQITATLTTSGSVSVTSTYDCSTGTCYRSTLNTARLASKGLSGRNVTIQYSYDNVTWLAGSVSDRGNGQYTFMLSTSISRSVYVKVTFTPSSEALRSASVTQKVTVICSSGPC